MIQSRAVPRTALALTILLAACGEPPTLFSTSNEPVTTTAGPEIPAIAGAVTLITGDRVILQPVTKGPPGTIEQAAQIAPRVMPGPGRSKIPFIIQERNGEFTVVPQDMAALVASGQLDPQLFNATTLVADGFGDDQRGDLPLVVTGQGDAAAFRRQMARPGLEVERTIPSLQAVAVRQDKGAPSPLLASLVVPAGGRASAAASDSSMKIWLDRPGLYSGALATTGDGIRDVTPPGVEGEIEAHDLTIRVLDTDGNPVGASAFIVGADPGTDFVFDFIIESSTFHLPAGRYMVWTFDANNSAILVAPRFALTGDSELVMDGRLAAPFDVDIVGQDLALADLSWQFRDFQGAIGIGVSGGGLPIQTGQIGADAPPGEVSGTASALLVPADEPTSPSAVYTVARSAPDQFFTGWKQTLRGRDFATVHARHAGAEGTSFVKSAGAIPPDNASLSFLGASHEGPFETTEHYFGPGFQWITSLDQTGFFGIPLAGLSQVAEYRAGRTTTESWNRAPLAPAFDGVRRESFGIVGSPRREGDLVIVQPSLFSDQGSPARGGFTTFLETSHARLLRNGEVIEEIDGLASPFPSFFASPEAAEYRIEQEVTRSSEVFDLSTEVSAAWTFRTRRAEGDFQILPVPALRFSPDLDEHNQTRARTLVLPVHVERVAGARTPRIARISVEASFDDGASWVRIPLLVLGADAFGLIAHPPGATHVSLRGSTADVEGNSAEVTVIRAYGLAPRA
jgi:hypothetical protein